MTVCPCHRLVFAVALAIALVVIGHRGLKAADNPQGKIIAEVVPFGNKLHDSKLILQQMNTHAGMKYDEATINEDVRRLYNTRWFTPNGIRVLTLNEPDGRIKVMLQFTELPGVIQEIIYDGAEHLSPNELHTLTGLRKGDAMSPWVNEIGRKAILRKYQEDGRYFASVELVEGTKPTDNRVVYSIVEGPIVKAAHVKFVGNEKAKSSLLLQHITTKREFLGFGGKFNPTTIDLDIKELTEYYHMLGYLAVQITSEVQRSDDMRHVTLIYHITEGARYHVADRTVDGVKSLSMAQVDKLVETKPGGVYNGKTVLADQTRIRDAIGYKGRAAVVNANFYETQPGVVQVQYIVEGDRGDPDRIGKVEIVGNEITKSRVILNQLYGLEPGQVLQYPQLKEAEMRLRRLGIFDMEDPPTVEVIPNELDQQFKDIRVRVHETRTGQFIVGASVNSDAGLTGNFALNERNFDITRIPTSFDDFRYGRAFRGAGQEFRLEAAPGTSFQRYSMTFREPYLFDTPFGLTTSLYYYDRSFAEYTEHRYGARVTLDRRLDPIWKASLSTRVEGVNISDIPYYAPWSIAKDAGGHFLLGLRAGVNRDTRDSYVYPTKGNVFDAGVEQVLGDYTFPIGTAEFTQFFSSKYLAREDGSGRHVLGVRTQFAVAGTNAPVFERFYAGGIRSFRGFSFRGVGPTENFLSTGGTFSFLNTVEYQIPVLPSDKMFVVAFVDHGTVESKFEIKNYRVSVGAGIRLSVPALGPLPLAFDFAVPLVQGPGDHRQLFSFAMGLFGSQ